MSEAPPRVGDVPEGISYSAWLASLDDAALTALLGNRPETLARPLRTFNDLASLLSNPASVGEALRQLDRSAVQIAGVLGTVGPSTPAQVEKALARSGDVPAGHVDSAIERLTRSGLAWPDARGRWQVPKAVATLAGGLCGYGPPVLATAERTQFFFLRAALDALGLGEARSAREAVFALSAWARDETAVAAAIAAAPQVVRTGLEQIAVNGPVRDLDDVAARWLSERCLLVQSGRDLATVPAELIAHVRGKRVVGVVRTEPGPAAVSPSDPEPLLAVGAGMRALLGVLDRVTLKPLQSGGIGVQEQRRLAKALDVEQDVVRRLLHLAGDAGLVSTGTRPGFVTTDGAAWLERDEVPAAVELVVVALDAGRTAMDQSSPLWGLSWHQARPSLRAVLAALVGHPDRPPLAWVTWRWYGAAEEQLAEIVDELEWLGLLTPSGVQPWAAAVAAGDVTAAAQAIEAVLPAEQDDVVIQADGTAVVAGRPSTALRRLLDRVARRESERTWRIEAGCIRAAYDEGADAASLLKELHSHSRHPVPQVVERLVHDVADRHGRIVVVPATTLLRVDDEPLAITLLRDRRLKALDLSEVQPGLLTSTKKPADVLAALRVAGYAPAGPPEPARRRPAGSRRPERSYAPRVASPADVVQALREAGAACADEVPLATVHQLTPPAYVTDGRFDHLPVDQRVLLVRALTDGGPVEIDYVDSGGRWTTRVVEELQDIGWLLEGWCRLREDERNFAPDGIRAVRPGE
jgi:hypothetical protein